MRAFGRDHWQRADELPLSRLQGPRRTRLRDQRAEVAPGLVRALDGPPGVGCGLKLPSCAVWAGAMLNFAFTEFYEVHPQLVRMLWEIKNSVLKETYTPSRFIADSSPLATLPSRYATCGGN